MQADVVLGFTGQSVSSDADERAMIGLLHNKGYYKARVVWEDYSNKVIV